MDTGCPPVKEFKVAIDTCIWTSDSTAVTSLSHSLQWGRPEVDCVPSATPLSKRLTSETLVNSFYGDIVLKLRALE